MEQALRPPISLHGKDDYFRRLYSSQPDFKQLAMKDADFACVLDSSGQLDFNDSAAVMQLSKTLLKVDFGLKLDLPDDRLCPPIPNRHNYILWLKELLDTTSYAHPGRKAWGLDIGTGASCIYPLLGTTQRSWYFVATDVDAKSLSYARKNVQLNGLEHRIRVIDRDPVDSFVNLDLMGMDGLDFVMMNPPFYASDDEMMISAQKKARPPLTVCTGAPVEMVCDGGEVAYVGRLIQESLQLRERVQWYTTMLGKLSSLEVLVEQLRANEINNFAVTELVQGNKTRRWALGWSLGPARPAQDTARGLKAAFLRKLLPPVTTIHVFTSPARSEVESLIRRLTDAIGVLELASWTWDKERLKGVGRARGNSWSRAWRRRKLGERAKRAKRATSVETEPQPLAIDTEACRLGFAISISVGVCETIASLNWLEGHDQALFESLGGFLQRKLWSR